MQHIINLKIDDNCEMAEVILDGKYVMMGNFWDFHPSGNPLTEIYGEFKGYSGLIKAICEYLGKKGDTAKLIKEKYDFYKETYNLEYSYI